VLEVVWVAVVVVGLLTMGCRGGLRDVGLLLLLLVRVGLVP
jgi:hypothetical protein